MSNVAPATATKIAATAVAARLSAGDANPKFTIAAIDNTPANSNHDTR
jgi:hypothetical protein